MSRKKNKQSGAAVGERKRAVVSRIFGAYYDLLPLPELEPELRGRLRGRLRLEDRSEDTSSRRPGEDAMRRRHLLIVGDHVDYSVDAKQEHAAIVEELRERDNVVYRAQGHELHSLGANLDRAVAVISLAQPAPRWGFLDRFLASCASGGVEAHIVFSKIDAVAEEDAPDIERLIALYRRLGYGVYVLNLLAPEKHSGDVARITAITRKGVTMLAGQSGTGKSTLLNLLLGREVQETAEVSDSTGKGRHTTTNSRLFVHANRTAMFIDTPGVKDWGVQHISRAELLAGYPELRPAFDECEFRDCLHESDSRGCAVQAVLQKSREFYREYYEKIEDIEADPNVAVPPHEAGTVHPERRRSLDAMIDSLKYSLKVRTGDYIKATGRVRTGRIPGN